VSRRATCWASITDILDLSKIEAGLLALESREFALADVIEHSLSMLRDRAASKALVLGSAIRRGRARAAWSATRCASSRCC